MSLLEGKLKRYRVVTQRVTKEKSDVMVKITAKFTTR